MYMQTEGKHARKERGGEGPTIISHWSVLSVLNDELLSRCRAKIPITSYYKEDLPHMSTFLLHDMSRSPRLTPSIFGNWITVEGGKGLGMKLTTCIIPPSLFAFWNRVLEVGMRLGYLAYSGKLLREKTFATLSQGFVICNRFLHKIWGCGILWRHQQPIHESFLWENFPPIYERFFPQKFPTIRY